MISFAEKSSRFLARLLPVGVHLLGLVSTAHADLTTGLVALDQPGKLSLSVPSRQPPVALLPEAKERQPPLLQPRHRRGGVGLLFFCGAMPARCEIHDTTLTDRTTS